MGVREVSGLENAILNQIRLAIPQGIITTNYQSADQHNPNDRQLEIFIHVPLTQISHKLDGVAKLKVACRLSLAAKTLTMRTIQKNFDVERGQKSNADEDDSIWQDDLDQQEYPNEDF